MTKEHVKRAARAAMALAFGAYGLVLFAPALMAGSVLPQRFHAAVALLLTVAWTVTALQDRAARSSAMVENRVLSGVGFFVWATYTVLWLTPNAELFAKVGLFALASLITGLILLDPLPLKHHPPRSPDL